MWPSIALWPVQNCVPLATSETELHRLNIIRNFNTWNTLWCSLPPVLGQFFSYILIFLSFYHTFFFFLSSFCSSSVFLIYFLLTRPTMQRCSLRSPTLPPNLNFNDKFTCCSIILYTYSSLSLKVYQSFFLFSQLYRASWYHQSLLFTNWRTIELF